MKYSIFFCFSLNFISCFNAQKNEVSIQYAYSISIPNAFTGKNEIDVYPDEMSVSPIRGSLGAGNNYGIEYNYRTKNEYILLGLSFSKFIGNQALFYHYDRNNLYQNLRGNNTRFQLQPGVKFIIPCKKIDFSVFSGILVPLSNKSLFHYTERDLNSNTTIDYDDEFRYNFSFGFVQRIGFEKKINTKIKVSGSLNYLIFSETTLRKTRSNYVINGEDRSDQLNAYERETIYYQSLNNFSNNEAYNNSYSMSSPKEELMISHNFSSISFLLGISYSF